MKLQTTIPISKGKHPIDYDSRVLLLGSCFVENIGEKLGYYKFQVEQNTFGILFNPMAIENLVQRALASESYHKDEVFQHEGIWNCFDAHSDLSATSEQKLLDNLNHGLEKTTNELRSATHIIITLGTAWIYRHNSTQKPVANCHKVPQKEFSKELLSVDAVQSSLKHMTASIAAVNPKANIIFTISPIRHLKDGFMENQRSKAHLISAVHETISENQTSTAYFPSYEIMLDELRDYRFYGKDMVHPNELAVDYIWERFKSTWISPESYAVMDEVEVVQKGLQHRPFNPNTEAHQKFTKSLRTKIECLHGKYPFIRFKQ
nr:GSCFA domain-containing protein [uncultured Allomuricauda sp.]